MDVARDFIHSGSENVQKTALSMQTEDDGPQRPRDNQDRNPVEKAVENRIAENFTNAKRQCRDAHERVRTALRMDSGNTLRSASVESSDLHIPALKRAVTTLLKHHREGLFPGEDFFEYIPSREEFGGAAQAMTALVRHQFRRQNFVGRMTDEALWDWVALGTCVEKVTWDLRVGTRRRSKRVTEPTVDFETGEILFRERVDSTREVVQIHSRPLCNTVNLLSFFPSHVEGVESLDDLDYVVEVSAITHDEMLENRQRTETIYRQGSPVIRQVGSYKNTEVIKRKDAGLVARIGNAETEGSETETEPRVHGFERLECWLRLNLKAMLSAKDEGGSFRFDDEAVSEFLEKWGLDKEDVAPGGWWVAETINGVLVRLERNPYPVDTLPYRICQYYRRRNCLFGDGVYQMAMGMQIALDATASNWVDLLGKITDPKYLVNPQFIDERHGSVDDQFTARDTNVIITRGTADPKNVTQAIHPPENLYHMATAGITQQFDMIRTMTGATAEIEGASGGSADRSATESYQKNTNSMTFVTLQNSRFEKQIIEEVLELIWPLNQQNLVQPEAIQLLGQDGQLFPAEVNPRDIAGDMTAYAMGTVELTNRMALGTTLTNTAAMLMQMGVIKPLGWARLILKTFRVPGKLNDLIYTDDEYAAMQQQAAMAAQQQQEPSELTSISVQNPGQIPIQSSDQAMIGY